MAAQPEQPQVAAGDEAQAGLLRRMAGKVRDVIAGTAEEERLVGELGQNTTQLLIEMGRGDLLVNSVVFQQVVGAVAGFVARLQAEEELTLLERMKAFMQWLYGDKESRETLDHWGEGLDQSKLPAYDDRGLLLELAKMYEQLESLLNQFYEAGLEVAEALAKHSELLHELEAEVDELMDEAGVSDVDRKAVKQKLSRVAVSTTGGISQPAPQAEPVAQGPQAAPLPFAEADPNVHQQEVERRARHLAEPRPGQRREREALVDDYYQEFPHERARQRAQQAMMHRDVADFGDFLFATVRRAPGYTPAMGARFARSQALVAGLLQSGSNVAAATAVTLLFQQRVLTVASRVQLTVGRGYGSSAAVSANPSDRVAQGYQRAIGVADEIIANMREQQRMGGDPRRAPGFVPGGNDGW